MKIAIENWLNDPQASYTDGLALFHKTKRDTEYDKFLEAGKGSKPQSLHHNMLRSQLSIHHRWLSDAVETVENETPEEKLPVYKTLIPLNQPQADKVAAKRQIDFSKLPKELQIIHESIKAGQDEVCTIHANMKDADTDEERAEIRSQLIQTEDYILEGWKTIDEYIKKPEDWTPTKTEGTDALELVKLKRRADNLVIYIPRDKKKLDKIIDIESDVFKTLEAKINDMQGELDHIRETLASHE